MFVLYPRQYRAKISDSSPRKRLSFANAHAAVPSSFGPGGAGAELVSDGALPSGCSFLNVTF